MTDLPTRVDPPPHEVSILAMERAVGRKCRASIVMFAVVFIIVRHFGERVGSEIIVLLLVLFPYDLLALILLGYILNAKSIISGRLRSSGRYVGAAGVEAAQFWVTWTLRLWPIFASLAFATIVLGLTEAVTGRAFHPPHLSDRSRGYCRYTGNQDHRAVFGCWDPAVQTSPARKDLAAWRAYYLQQTCTDPIYAWFRHTETAFRFVYSSNWRTLATIDVSDRECEHTPPQP